MSAKRRPDYCTRRVADINRSTSQAWIDALRRQVKLIAGKTAEIQQERGIWVAIVPREYEERVRLTLAITHKNVEVRPYEPTR